MLQLIKVTEEGNDLNEIRTLFKEYEYELGENLCFQDFEKELNDPLYKYVPPKGSLYLAKWNNETAGCIALTPMNEEGVCEMKRLFVKPAYRKHKIGKALVEQLLKDAVEAGYTKMKLDTLKKLETAIDLYKKYEFIETTAYYHNPLSNVVYMEKVLG
ncbi:MAG: GNAT family N-acetyltransferase [Sphingobacteriales bacterium]|nr:GNAT family N-acetyltransferase [Sphingobacteriales bacterium]MBI3718201.1 GNAT family N-acetyltransferase [Sphingobacteriales bacterium]